MFYKCVRHVYTQSPRVLFNQRASCFTSTRVQLDTCSAWCVSHLYRYVTAYVALLISRCVSLRDYNTTSGNPRHVAQSQLDRHVSAWPATGSATSAHAPSAADVQTWQYFAYKNKLLLTKINSGSRDSSDPPPPLYPHLADRAYTFVNVVAPWLVHVYTKFGPDGLQFAGVISESLTFPKPRSYYCSAWLINLFKVADLRITHTHINF